MHRSKLLVCSGTLLLVAVSSGCASTRRKPVVGSVPSAESSFRSADGADEELPGPTTAVLPGAEVAPEVAGEDAEAQVSVVGDPTPHPDASAEPDQVAPPPDDPWGPNKTPMGLEIRNTCRYPVQVFLGPEPPTEFYSPIVLAGYGSIHLSVMPGGTVWLLDEARQPLASATFDPQFAVVVVDPTCEQFQVR